MSKADNDEQVEYFRGFPGRWARWQRRIYEVLTAYLRSQRRVAE